ncbi:MAG TPA: GreA/GreB family elongation factor [Polyangiaceae bacterium]|nr:GreA/GreB family elongation factor [Polyangiaceae bacterium]
MSKAFTKEGAPDAPLVPPRSPLPPGVTNYVTPRGLALLRDELRHLQAERASLEAAGPPDEGGDATARLAALAARVAELESRLAVAELVEPPAEPPDEVRFGATVRVRNEAGEERRYQIVGVDEADAAAGRIAFLAPLARALLGKRAGEAAVVRTPRGDEELEVLELRYEAPPPEGPPAA